MLQGLAESTTVEGGDKVEILHADVGKSTLEVQVCAVTLMVPSPTFSTHVCFKFYSMLAN